METGSASEVAVGRVAKTYGPNGELVLTLYDTFAYENNEEPVYVSIDNIWTPLFFRSFQRRGRNKAVTVFDDLENEYRASELVGKELYVLAESEDEEDDDEIYMEDLIGYDVVFEGHKQQAVIVGFTESEFNPLFELELDGRDVLIPAADDFIVRIDQAARVVTMDIPDGLLEL